jgi:putative phosphoesterase
MLVGVISDSHDNVPAIERAVEILNTKKVGFVIHAGDFVAPFSLKPLENLRCPWIGVFGNNDGEQKGLTNTSKGRIQLEPYELNLDGKKVVVVHNLEAFEAEDLIQKGAQIIISGHTHQPGIRKDRADTVVFVNPGELGGWLFGKKTLALIDTESLDGSIEELPL